MNMLYHYLEIVPPAGNLTSVLHSFALSAFAFPIPERKYYQYSTKTAEQKLDAVDSHRLKKGSKVTI